MIKVFIAGGTGFIGKSIVKQVDPKKYKLYILTRKDKINDNQVHFIKGDISDSCFLLDSENDIHFIWKLIFLWILVYDMTYEKHLSCM